jgi:hypothetical protein
MSVKNFTFSEEIFARSGNYGASRVASGVPDKL